MACQCTLGLGRSIWLMSMVGQTLRFHMILSSKHLNHIKLSLNKRNFKDKLKQSYGIFVVSKRGNNVKSKSVVCAGNNLSFDISDGHDCVVVGVCVLRQLR